jgi:cystathionine gamma-synthase
MKLQTRLALAGQETDGAYRSVVPPIYQSAIFKFENPDTKPAYDYSRSGNPGRNALEEVLADLEGGAGAVATSSGMSAVTTVLGLYDADAHILCSHDCYGGTERLLTVWARQGRLKVSFVDLTDVRAVEAAIRPDTKAIWAETPSNPLLRIIDLAAVSAVAKGHDLELIVDNTFLSPLFQRPFEHGADLIVHSTTKYLNGHSDIVGGAVVARTEERAADIRFTSNALGLTAAPFDSWLLVRGLKTLPLRLRQHEENAFAVARFLAGHDAVDEVFYPGLETHVGHDIARKQQSGFGGIVSFRLKGTGEDVRRVLGATRVFALAESLGGVESLIEQPATMSHASMRPEQREEAGITEQIIRLSVGIEDPSDLLADLELALSRVGTAQPARVKTNGVKRSVGVPV